MLDRFKGRPSRFSIRRETSLDGTEARLIVPILEPNPGAMRTNAQEG